MNRERAKRRRAQHQRRGSFVPIIAAVAVVAVLAVGTFFMTRSSAPAQQLSLQTNNVLGAADAPATVEDWSDFM
ncbi:MAG: hypothetical protein IT305_16135 [Chloroflexi bacterium]|nr:hypothetical protein [Chloroflexota bacterium]